MQFSTNWVTSTCLAALTASKMRYTLCLGTERSANPPIASRKRDTKNSLPSHHKLHVESNFTQLKTYKQPKLAGYGEYYQIDIDAYIYITIDVSPLHIFCYKTVTLLAYFQNYSSKQFNTTHFYENYQVWTPVLNFFYYFWSPFHNQYNPVIGYILTTAMSISTP